MASWLRGSVASGFTLVELIVVLVIIVLILAIAVPGLSAMATESRFGAAIQTVQANLTRTYIAARADRNMSALRFVPGYWDNAGDEEQAPQDRQNLVSYAYRTTTDVERPPGSGNFVIEYGERFVRREGSRSIPLPQDIWVAPDLALSVGSSPADAMRDEVLRGDISSSAAVQPDPDFYPDPTDTSFFTPDDFLVVFDPQTGLNAGVRPSTAADRGEWPRYRLVGADYSQSPLRESDQIERFAFSGLVFYRRELLVALDASANADERQAAIRRFGRPYYVHRNSGSLVMGLEQQEVTP